MTISLLEPLRYRRLVKARLAGLHIEAIRAQVRADRAAALGQLDAKLNQQGLDGGPYVGEAESLNDWLRHCRSESQKVKAA